jgi:hypothetical protein
MEINELNKKQLILLTLLITFVVSIATGIVTVSLMNQMPKSVPQIVNNVIQRTIEKVVPQDQSTVSNSTTTKVINDGNLSNYIIPIYRLSKDKEIKDFDEGVIISTEGLVLVDSFNMDIADSYLTSMDSKYFSLSLVKSFSSFSIFKITSVYENSSNTNDSENDSKDLKENTE